MRTSMNHPSHHDRLRRISLILALALTLLLMMFFCAIAGAVPANPTPFDIDAGHGSTLTVRLHGDERVHWTTDADGYAVIHQREKRRWVYARQTATGLEATDTVVGTAQPSALGIDQVNAAALAATADTEIHKRFPSRTAKAAARKLASGTRNNLVILVSFADKAMEYSVTDFDRLFNESGYSLDGARGSVRDFYLEVSGGRLTLNSIVVGPVTLDNGYAYYGGDKANGNDIRPTAMVREAIDKLEAGGFDFSQADADNDGIIDGLTIIHAGAGEECGGNDDNYIWSHKHELAMPVTYDGVRMQMYHTEAAVRGWDAYPSTQGITRIGVICHEMGHFLGLPDLYDLDGDSQGTGDFCLMSGGCWNGNHGTSPAHPSAYCKADLGWVTVRSIASAGSYSLAAVQTGQTVYKLAVTAASSEYYLIENRQGLGFDASLPGYTRGLLIWHIDESQSDNDTQTRYRVDLKEAGTTQDLEMNTSSGDDNDYFRAGHVHAFTKTSSPNHIGHNGEPAVLDLIDISASGNTMTFSAAGDEPKPAAPTHLSAITGELAGTVVLSWTAADNAKSYRVYYTRTPSTTFDDHSSGQPANGENVGNTTAVTITGLDAGISYTFAVTACGDVRESDPSDLVAVDAGAEINIESTATDRPDVPVVSAWRAATGDRITLTWTAADGASEYQVYRATSETAVKVPISNWITSRAFIDNDAARTQAYYYWVCARNSVGTGDRAMVAVAAEEDVPVAMLAILSVGVPETIALGEKTAVTVVVANVGTADTPVPVDIALWKHSDAAPADIVTCDKRQTIETLRAGDTASVTFQIDYSDAGVYTMWAMVAPSTTIATPSAKTDDMTVAKSKVVLVQDAIGDSDSLSASLTGGCFIATAAYGSYLDGPVVTLRHFRDQQLRSTALGRGFIRTYYRLSPPMAQVIGRDPMLRASARALLTPLVVTVTHPTETLVGLIVVLSLTTLVRARLRSEPPTLPANL